jgi:hypothetical protein
MWTLFLLLGQLANPPIEEGTKGWTLEAGARSGEGPPRRSRWTAGG